MTRHLTRASALLVALLAALGLLAGGTAHAAGTGDVELIPSSPDSTPRTAFRVEPSQDSLSFELVNLADAPRTARLYAAGASRGEGGGITVGAQGSAPWLQLVDGEVALAPKESRSVRVPLDLTLLPEGETVLGAVVLEAAQGSVTVRVATLVTVEPRSALPLPLWAVVVASAAIALVALGLLLVWLRRRRDDEDAEAEVPAREPALV